MKPYPTDASGRYQPILRCGIAVEQNEKDGRFISWREVVHGHCNGNRTRHTLALGTNLYRCLECGETRTWGN